MSRRYRPFDPFERGGPFEGAREIRLPRPPRRFWIGAGLFGLAFLIFIFASPIIWFVTEGQWFAALGYQSVFTTQVALQVFLFVGSFALSLIYLAVNVYVALRIRSGSGLRAVGIRKAVLRSPAGGIALAAAVLVALILSGGAGGQWQYLALFLHASPTGTADPVLHMDISFYLLTLPFLHSIVNWALGLGFMTILVIAGLSGILGIFALALAGWMWLGRYDLLYSHNSGIVWGAAYTDVHARLPLFTFQAGASVVLAGALIANMWLRRLWLPVAAAVLWVLLLLIGQAYPAIIQTFFVTPSAQSYELPYIQNQIAGTRAAYGLSNVTVSNFTGDQPVTAQDVQNDQATVNNLRLWDYA